MAILDERGEFADATVVTGAAGATIVGDVIDLGSPGYAGTANTVNYPGDGETIYLVITTATQIITGGTPSDIQFFLVSDANPSLSASGSAPAVLAECTEHARSIAITTDDATAVNVGVAAGTASYTPNTTVGNPPPILCVALPPGKYERYLGIIKLIGAQTVTAGAVNAFLTKDPSRYIMHPNAIT